MDVDICGLGDSTVAWVDAVSDDDGERADIAMLGADAVAADGAAARTDVAVCQDSHAALGHGVAASGVRACIQRGGGEDAMGAGSGCGNIAAAGDLQCAGACMGGVDAMVSAPPSRNHCLHPPCGLCGGDDHGGGGGCAAGLNGVTGGGGNRAECAGAVIVERYGEHAGAELSGVDASVAP